MPKLILFILSSFLVHQIYAQQRTTYTNFLWVNYNNTLVVNHKWKVVNDLQIRSRDFVSKWSQFALRTGVTRKLDNHFAVTAGFAWFGNVRYFNEEAVVANEWRPWQEISFNIQTAKCSLLQRLRLEQRFLQRIVNGKKLNDFEYRHRLRYRLEFGLPLSKKQHISLNMGNEIMVNINHLGDSLFFDQNRTFAMLNFNLSTSTFFQFQFIKIFQFQAANKILENQNVFRFSLHQQIKRKT